MSIRKSSKIFPDQYKERAIANGISIQTVYARLQRGWDLEKAVTEKPGTNTYAHKAHREDGWITASERPRLKQCFSTSIYQDLEPTFNKALEESGLSRSEFIANAVEQYLLKLWTPKTNLSKIK
jgi:hypothetical protein